MNLSLSLIYKLLCLLVLYSITRIIFYTNNLSFFENVIFLDFIEGVRFDLSALIYINLLYFLFRFISFKYRNIDLIHNIGKYFFITSNTLFIILNNVDIVYYNFNLKRSSLDIFQIINKSNDIIYLIPQYLLYYWSITLVTIFQIYLLFIIIRISSRKLHLHLNNITLFFTNIIFLFGFLVIAARGGIQLKPIKPINAGEIFNSRNHDLILNTPFNIIHTLGKDELHIINDISENKIDKLYKTIKTYDGNNPKDINVVILIIESLSKEFIGYYNNQVGFTPFIDDLITKSLVFENAYANGLKSIDAVPAIISSIPSLMNEPFITSKYSNNSIDSLPSILNDQGYESFFFHGGRRGTMGFLAFCNRSKFDYYFGMEDFPDQSFFDGSWGIYDEPFLEFSAEELNKAKQPFFATIFTLSSHPPYNLPKKYNGVFPKGKSKIHELIGYTDYSLKMFFKKIQNEKWFKNTIFIITADHTSSESFVPKYKSYLGRHQIPLIFYSGDNSLKGVNKKITQHIDIMPTILDYISCNKPFYSFGKSVFREYQWAIISKSDEKFLITNNGVLHKDKNTCKTYKNIELNEDTNTSTIDLLKMNAILQTFNNNMILNNLSVNKLFRSDD